MKVSFARLWNMMEEIHTSPEDEKAMSVIRTGLNLRKSDCGDFWDDFVTVCGNAEAMAALLDVPREKITSWAGKIHELIARVDGEDTTKTTKSEMLPTGDVTADFGKDDAVNPDNRPYPS
jgi:hypothetical protein